MPSEAAMRAARAIRKKGFFIDYIGRDAPDEWMVEIAEIIDQHMESPPPTAEEMRRHEAKYGMRFPRPGEMSADLGLAAPDNAAFLKSRQKP